jgi:hypothetical protein
MSRSEPFRASRSIVPSGSAGSTLSAGGVSVDGEAQTYPMTAAGPAVLSCAAQCAVSARELSTTPESTKTLTGPRASRRPRLRAFATRKPSSSW